MSGSTSVSKEQKAEAAVGPEFGTNRVHTLTQPVMCR